MENSDILRSKKETAEISNSFVKNVKTLRFLDSDSLMEIIKDPNLSAIFK